MNDLKFKIIVSSDIDYDDLCAEIYFGDEFVALISQENGFENLHIEIHPSLVNKCWSFNFSEFEEILRRGKELLWEMRKLS